MRLSFAFLAKYVELTPQKIWNAIGGDFDGITVESLPATIGPFWLVVKCVEDDPAQAGIEHRLSIEISGPGGPQEEMASRPVVCPKKDLTRGNSPPSFTGVIQIVLQLQDEGPYKFHVMLDGNEVAGVPLLVNSAKSQGTATEAQTLSGHSNG